MMVLHGDAHKRTLYHESIFFSVIQPFLLRMVLLFHNILLTDKRKQKRKCTVKH